MPKTVRQPKKSASRIHYGDPLRLPSRVIEALGYDAAASSKRRRMPSSLLRHEDQVLDPTQRRKLLATSRDLGRNFAVARWMVNKHLDWVANFTFQSRTGIPELDDRIEQLVDWWSRPHNFDAAGRHGLFRALRLAEGSRVRDGDAFFVLLNDGTVQTVEGDRVCEPSGGLPSDYREGSWSHGVLLNASGGAQAYMICRRGKYSQFEFDRIVPAPYAIHHAWWDRFDQTRGISPLAPAINLLRDAYEGATYALAQMKVAQLFGLATFREAETGLGTVTGSGDQEDEEPFKVDFDKGPFHLDLDVNDKAQFLQSQNPSQQFQDFWKAVLMAAMKSLNLPWSFYDEASTNFFGSRAALNLYVVAAEVQRADVRATADALVRWRSKLWILDGELNIERYGLSIPELRFDWQPRGVRWWNPVQEISGAKAAIRAGLDTRTRILREISGADFRETVDQIAEENDYIREKLGEGWVDPEGKAELLRPASRTESSDATAEAAS